MGVDAMVYIAGTLAPDVLERVNDAARSLGGDGVSVHAAKGDTSALVRWDTFDRYYDEGYERGPWPTISAVIDLLRAVSPSGEVYYHGDTLWYFETYPFTRDEQDAIWRHWAGPHWADYYRPERWLA